MQYVGEKGSKFDKTGDANVGEVQVDKLSNFFRAATNVGEGVAVGLRFELIGVKNDAVAIQDKQFHRKDSPVGGTEEHREYYSEMYVCVLCESSG